MTLIQYSELMRFVAENNGWGKNMYDNALKRRRCFKYIEASFDTRDGHIWRIVFRVSGGDKGTVFRIEQESDIQKIYNFLNEKI